jgi:hypothetical protein
MNKTFCLKQKRLALGVAKMSVESEIFLNLSSFCQSQSGRGRFKKPERVAGSQELRYAETNKLETAHVS